MRTFFQKLQNVKEMVRPLFKKQTFRNPFDSTHIKESQTLAKSSREHFHDIFSSLWETLIRKTSPLVVY